ncbi:hypothetical protein JAO78_008620 [Alishewanella sp. 16-MA]|uniref:Lipoprotein n=1 Tax=Alishewanella maricola TaxID=2795740 RepID=A0ABS8C3H3_9ALTE|nr:MULTISPECIES: hypothetical protein [Alishewanella]MCB5226878.1 hypothetical protein [Alishewanella maricola]MDP5035400.1 hypothetical protein [Alishewanella sp.]MDP5187847.1 hypothetical protein [Alishewanella sp.]MDP5457959.1 hypothetical protein [Alishewanella sp. SMS8]
MLSTKWIVLGGCLLLGNLLSGCTALGMLGDSQLRSDNRRVVQDQQTGQSKTVEPPLLLTELGIALDSAVIEGVKKLGKDEQPKEICKHNGHFNECRPLGKQRSDIID